MTFDVGPGLSISTDGRIRVLTINRPDARNAIDQRLHHDLAKVWRQLAYDDSAAVVVLTGAGPTFSAGGDFGWLLEQHRDPSSRDAVFEETAEIMSEMIRCPLPVIAAVNGPAIGLGCSLAVLCDIVLMAETAHMADPHVSIGLVAGDGGAATWPIYSSLLRAKELLFTGDRISAHLAVELGLATRVVADDRLLDEAMALARRLAELPARALRDTKRALNMHLQRAVSGPLEMALAAERQSMDSTEHGEIVARLVSGVRGSSSTS